MYTSYFVHMATTRTYTSDVVHMATKRTYTAGSAARKAVNTNDDRWTDSEIKIISISTRAVQ